MNTFYVKLNILWFTDYPQLNVYMYVKENNDQNCQQGTVLGQFCYSCKLVFFFKPLSRVYVNILLLRHAFQ